LSSDYPASAAPNIGGELRRQNEKTPPERGFPRSG